MSVPRLTTEQAIILTAFTGKMLCPSFAEFHAAIEERLGRPVFTHEFGDAAFSERIREEYREDALLIVPEEAA